MLGGAPVPYSSPHLLFPPVNTRDVWRPVASLREHSEVAVTAGYNSLHTSLIILPRQSRGTCENRMARASGVRQRVDACEAEMPPAGGQGHRQTAMELAWQGLIAGDRATPPCCPYRGQGWEWESLFFFLYISIIP